MSEKRLDEIIWQNAPKTWYWFAKIITFLCLYVINHQFHPQFLIDPQPVNMSTQRASVHKHDFEEPDAKKPKMIDGRVEALKLKIDQLQVEMQANVDRVENKKLVRVCEAVNVNRKLIEVMEIEYKKQMEEMETKYKKQIEGMHTKYKKQIEQNVLMGPPLSDHLEVLTSICQWSCESREIFLETSNTVIGVIYATICNVLSGFYPTNIHTKKIVEKHWLGLQKFINLGTSFTSKKKILASEETGEAIFFIIKSSVLPFLANYMKMLITQKIHFE